MGKKDINIDNVNIKEIVELFNRFELEEINLEENGLKLELKRDLPIKLRRPASIMPLSQPLLQTHIENQLVTQTKIEKTDKSPTIDNNYDEIVSPMIGTFYRATSPDDKPFVQEGDFVNPSTTICIIEAMKMMNEIQPEVSGKITKILVENGKPVQAGTALFLIESK